MAKSACLDGKYLQRCDGSNPSPSANLRKFFHKGLTLYIFYCD